jgi:hypothetical protein
MSDLPPEAGLGQHYWTTQYEQLRPSLEDEPEEALPELAALVEQMLGERSLAADDVVLAESEQLASFRPAKELADRARQGEDLPPGDVAFAIGELRALYESMVEERRAP